MLESAPMKALMALLLCLPVTSPEIYPNGEPFPLTVNVVRVVDHDPPANSAGSGSFIVSMQLGRRCGIPSIVLDLCRALAPCIQLKMHW